MLIADNRIPKHILAAWKRRSGETRMSPLSTSLRSQGLRQSAQDLAVALLIPAAKPALALMSSALGRHGHFED